MGENPLSKSFEELTHLQRWMPISVADRALLITSLTMLSKQLGQEPKKNASILQHLGELILDIDQALQPVSEDEQWYFDNAKVSGDVEIIPDGCVSSDSGGGGAYVLCWQYVAGGPWADPIMDPGDTCELCNRLRSPNELFMSDDGVLICKRCYEEDWSDLDGIPADDDQLRRTRCEDRRELEELAAEYSLDINDPSFADEFDPDEDDEGYFEDDRSYPTDQEIALREEAELARREAALDRFFDDSEPDILRAQSEGLPDQA